MSSEGKLIEIVGDLWQWAKELPDRYTKHVQADLAIAVKGIVTEKKLRLPQRVPKPELVLDLDEDWDI